MKRSEMIKLMIKASNEKHMGESVNDPSFPERLASTMLEASEKAGMLPTSIYSQKDYRYIWEPEEDNYLCLEDRLDRESAERLELQLDEEDDV